MIRTSGRLWRLRDPRRRIWIARFNSTSSSLSRPKFNILFCGTDEFSIASLRAVLAQKDLWSNVHVLTPPERRHGRNMSQLFVPPLRKFAQDEGLSTSTFKRDIPPHIARSGSESGSTSVAGPSRLPATTPNAVSPTSRPSSEDNDFMPDWCTDTRPSNLIITASFGYILPESFLRPFPSRHRLNVHPSLLPKYRGAAPIQWAIAYGDPETGVTVQSLADKRAGVDTGDILGQMQGIKITPHSNYNELLPVLADAGGNVLANVLREVYEQRETRSPQGQVTKAEQLLRINRAPKVEPELAHVNWRAQSAVTLDRLHRGIGHQIPLWSENQGVRIQLLDPKALTPDQVPIILRSHLRGHDYNPGRAWLDLSPASNGERMLIACVPHGTDPYGNAWYTHKIQGNSWLQVTKVKPAGSRVMSVRDFFNGLPATDRKRNWMAFKNRHHQVEPFVSYRAVDGSLPEDGIIASVAASSATRLPSGWWSKGP